MEYPITWRGAPVGTVTVAAARGGLSFSARCHPATDAVLRLYTRAPDGRAYRLGVPAPDAGGARTLTRFLSADALRQAGMSPDAPPTAYDLSASAPQSRTGDPLLDAGLASGALTCTYTAEGLRVSCPFTPGSACALAFALTACRIEDGRAVLLLPQDP